MKKQLLFITILLISICSNAQNRLVNTIFLNDTLSIQSYQLKTTNLNEEEILYMMLGSDKRIDKLEDGICFILEPHYYCIYVPQRHIKFTVRALHNEKIANHFIWMLQLIRSNLNNITLLTKT